MTFHVTPASVKRERESQAKNLEIILLSDLSASSDQVNECFCLKVSNYRYLRLGIKSFGTYLKKDKLSH